MVGQLACRGHADTLNLPAVPFLLSAFAPVLWRFEAGNRLRSSSAIEDTCSSSYHGFGSLPLQLGKPCASQQTGTLPPAAAQLSTGSVFRAASGSAARSSGCLTRNGHAPGPCAAAAALPLLTGFARRFATDKIAELEVGIPAEEGDAAGQPKAKPDVQDLDPAHLLKVQAQQTLLYSALA